MNSYLACNAHAKLNISTNKTFRETPTDFAPHTNNALD